MPLRPPAFRRPAAALALALVLFSLAACGGDVEKRLDQLSRAGIILPNDAGMLRDDLRAGEVRAAEARHDIEMFSRSRDALAGAGFPDLGAALRQLDALRTAGTIGAAEVDRLKSGLVAVWDPPAVSAAARRVSWLRSRKETLSGEAPSTPRDDAAQAAPPLPERVAVDSDDAAARAIRRIDDQVATAQARDLLSPALAQALRLRAASGDQGRAAVEARLAHLLATPEPPPAPPPALPEAADTAPEPLPPTQEMTNDPQPR